MPKLAKFNVSQTMFIVIAATLPALGFLSYWQGAGFLINLAVAIAAALVFESLFAGISALADGSAILTAVLFSAGVPAFAPIWLPIVGMFFAIVVAKHLFGGLGHNIFNPAMVAYAVVLISFPAEMVVWPSWTLDAISAATPLDHANPSLLDHDLAPFFILNSLWLLGGLLLWFFKIIRWHIPLAVLTGFMLTAIFFPHPLIHLGLGASMIGAFFIATDPVTAPATVPARLIYGLLIGCLIVLLRQYSSYPDGVAFAILLANICTPLMDQLSIRISS